MDWLIWTLKALFLAFAVAHTLSIWTKTTARVDIEGGQYLGAGFGWAAFVMLWFLP